MRTLLRVLVIGFAAVIALLALAAIIEVNNARSIAASTADLVKSQLNTASLLDEVEREQEILNAALYRLSSNPEKVNRDRILADLDQTDREVHKMVTEARGGPNDVEWSNLERAVLDFSQQARELLKQRTITTASSRDLFFRHELVTAAAARLVDLSYAHAVETRSNMDQQTLTLKKEAELLLGASILIALIAAVVTVRIAVRVFRQMESQQGELSRVSFRLLETQESTARRFSHELHDELGGSLTAIKSNLAAIAANPADRGRIEDCVKLVDDSIRNVRELSQLLRPTILDDFGLDAGIRWLTDRFRDRARIEVEYKSEFDERLPDETETHLFRIVQEALTNVARHSQATRVRIHLRKEGSEIRLTIQDNGKGMVEPRAGGMGLNGMRARARSAGGELTMKSTPGGGVTIEVSAPLGKMPRVETEETV
jgi:signal transduction histidine kinase